LPPRSCAPPARTSITITGDTYTSVVHELDTERAKADAAAALVPRTHAGTMKIRPQQH
jgi:hypothetical protein